MSLFIDTSKTVDHEIEGVTFRIRVLPQRKLLDVVTFAKQVAEIIAGRTADDLVTSDEVKRIQDRNFEILRLGIAGWDDVTDPTEDQIDTIPLLHWAGLVGRVITANRITEEDAKN